MALARAVVEVSARTRIHGGGQHEARGKSERHGGAGDAYRAIFQRLAHNLEDVAGEFRQLVQKEHAVVSEGNFAGPRNHAAADQAGVGDGVVRRAKRPRAHQAGGGIEHTRDAVNFGGLQCLFESKGRKDRRHALGQHGFAGAGRADHQNVVTAGRGHFQRALGGLLSAHIFEVDGKLLRLRQRRSGIRGQRRNAIGAIQQSDNFHQRLHRIDADAGDHRRLTGVGFRHDEVHDLVAARGNGDGQRAAHPAHPAIERKFAHQDVVA